MDSISENVVAIIAVVVGILIIGTALVPIVEHASGGPGTTETVTGSNEYQADWIFPFAQITENYVLKLDDGNATLNGNRINGPMTVANNSPMDNLNDLALFVLSTSSIIVYDMEDGTITLSEGTITITSNQASVTGDYSGDPYENTFSLTDAILYSEDATDLTDNIPASKLYSLMASCTIGDGQTLFAYSEDTSVTPITTNSASVPSGMTLTKNSNGTVTVVSPQDAIIGPIGWSQTITTGGTSQYAALYGIIPIMCILAMAYVLIRRF